MQDLDAIKKTIAELMTQRLGNLSDADVLSLRTMTNALNYDEREFSQLLQEVHGAINWDAIRDLQQGTDRVVRPIQIFGEEVKSLEKLGSVLYQNRLKALKYLDDEVLLKENVIYLSHQNVDLTIAMMDLYHAERNAEKRFLKVCYQLNGMLPFALLGQNFDTLAELFAQAWKNYDSFLSLFNKFAAGHLQIWTARRFPQVYAMMPAGVSFDDFLYFIYSIDASYPFYISGEMFDDVEALVQRANLDINFWSLVLDAVKDNSLYIWLERKGLGKLVSNYKAQMVALTSKEKNSDALSKTLVQRLLETLKPDLQEPEITVSVADINLLGIQAKVVQQPILISLAGKGFLRGKVFLDTPTPGLTLSLSQFTLSNLEENTSVSLSLIVDPTKLLKDRLYTLSILITTDYQSIKIPVAIKTVFPTRAFLLYLLKYGFFGALFFGFIRVMLFAASGHSRWLSPELAWDALAQQLPANHPAYIAILFLLIVVPVVAWPKIKKIESL